jgi:proliferating cell nuclear antigen
MAAAIKRRTATLPLSTLLTFTDAISALVPECILNISPEGLHTRAVDFANIGMVIANAKVNKGSTLEAKIGIDITSLKNTLTAISKMVPSDTLIVMNGKESDDRDRPYLEIEVQGTFRQNIRIKTLDKRTVRKEPNPPVITLPIRIDLERQDLLNAVAACAIRSDILRIAVDKEGVFTMAARGDTDHHKIEISKGAAGIGAAIYSIDYLKDIAKCMEGSKCTLYFQSDHPVEIRANLGGEVLVKYLLAPRIPTDEESKEDWI